MSGALALRSASQVCYGVAQLPPDDEPWFCARCRRVNPRLGRVSDPAGRPPRRIAPARPAGRAG